MSSKQPVILHIPHWSLDIPTEYRGEMLLSDSDLQIELLRMTDWHTHLAAEGDWAEYVLAAEVSRLVCDLERFRDDRDEFMSKVGMGAVYTHSHDGKLIRNVSVAERENILKRFYDPHHRRLEEMVTGLLSRDGYCLILDIHSFAGIPLPYEPCQDPERPDICIGYDDYHINEDLVGRAVNFFEKLGFRVGINTPFSGSIVPGCFWRKERSVYSLMIEINRELIQEEDGRLRMDNGMQILGGIRDLATELCKRISSKTAQTRVRQD